jgi:hypothetical protein
MRRTCFGLLLLIAAMSGCARWGPPDSGDPFNGFSPQWLTTDAEAQSRTDTLIQKSQEATKPRVTRPPANSADTGSPDQSPAEEAPADK